MIDDMHRRPRRRYGARHVGCSLVIALAANGLIILVMLSTRSLIIGLVCLIALNLCCLALVFAETAPSVSTEEWVEGRKETGKAKPSRPPDPPSSTGVRPFR